MYIIKATFKNIHSGTIMNYYVGKILKNKVYTYQNRDISVNPDDVTGYKYLSCCRKAMYIYFSAISAEAFTKDLTVSVNYIEVK